MPDQEQLPNRLASAVTRSNEHWFLLLIFAACLLPALFSMVTPFILVQTDSKLAELHDAVFAGSQWLILGSLTPATYYFAKRFPLRRSGWQHALAIHVAGASCLCVTWSALSMGLGLLLHRHAVEGPHVQVYIGWVLTSIPWALFTYTTILGCVYAFSYFVEAREKEALASHLKAQLFEAKLAALRMQLNPHFLFNSLNAILVLIRENNTGAASRVIELLGEVLHQTLKLDPRHKVPLSEELQFLGQYLAIEQVRFADRLQVTWSIEKQTRSLSVPGFILQPLVENSIKHGITKRAGTGRIEISARIRGSHLELAVSDDGIGIGPVSPDGVGLSNTKERLRLLYGDDASINIHQSSTGGTEVVLSIPHNAESA